MPGSGLKDAAFQLPNSAHLVLFFVLVLFCFSFVIDVRHDLPVQNQPKRMNANVAITIRELIGFPVPQLLY